jgi:hypothetical protein
VVLATHSEFLVSELSNVVMEIAGEQTVLPLARLYRYMSSFPPTYRG